MLFLQDTFGVIGERQFDFEDAVRESYAAAIADDDTRFLSYMQSVHGSAEGYFVATLTALRHGAALDRLVHRLRYGDLATFATHIASLRYRSHSSLLVRAEWLQAPEVDLAAIPVADVDHATAMFREDAFEGRGINAALARQLGDRAPSSSDVLTLETAFRPALDADSAARVLYRITDNEKFTDAWRTDTGWADWSGSLTPDLPDGIRATGRYLRSAPWSPSP